MRKEVGKIPRQSLKVKQWWNIYGSGCYSLHTCFIVPRARAARPDIELRKSFRSIRRAGSQASRSVTRSAVGVGREAAEAHGEQLQSSGTLHLPGIGEDGIVLRVSKTPILETAAGRHLIIDRDRTIPPGVVDGISRRWLFTGGAGGFRAGAAPAAALRRCELPAAFRAEDRELLRHVPAAARRTGHFDRGAADQSLEFLAAAPADKLEDGNRRALTCAQNLPTSASLILTDRTRRRSSSQASKNWSLFALRNRATTASFSTRNDSLVTGSLPSTR